MDGGTDGILGLGILPKPGQFSLAEISNIRLLIKSDTLQHLLEIDRNLPKGAELTTMFSDIKSIRGFLKPETITRINALTYGKQDGDLTLNRIQKVTADDGRVPTYYGGQNLGTGIYTSLTTLSASKNDILDVANFYKANKGLLQNILKIDFSKISSNFANINSMLKGLVTDDSQAFRLRLKNMKERFDNGRLILVDANKRIRRLYQLIDNAQGQLYNLLEKIKDLNEKRSITYNGYDFTQKIFGLDVCHYSATPFTAKGVGDYLVQLTKGCEDRIKTFLSNPAGGCGYTTQIIDIVATLSTGLRQGIEHLRDMLTEIKNSLEILSGNVSLTIEGRTEKFSDGMLGAMRKEIFDISMNVANLDTMFDNMSKEFDSLRNEIKEKYDKYSLR
jgi:hypothetical protein